MEAFWARAIYDIVVNGVALDFIRPWTSMFMSMAAAAAAAMRCSCAGVRLRRLDSWMHGVRR